MVGPGVGAHVFLTADLAPETAPCHRNPIKISYWCIGSMCTPQWARWVGQLRYSPFMPVAWGWQLGIISSRKCQVFGVVFDSSVRGERSEFGNLGRLSSVFVMLTALTLLQSFHIYTWDCSSVRLFFACLTVLKLRNGEWQLFFACLPVLKFANRSVLSIRDQETWGVRLGTVRESLWLVVLSFSKRCD